MRWRCVETFEQIPSAAAADDQEPGAAGADLTRGKIPEPDAGPRFAARCGPIQVQVESRPRAPPLPARTRAASSSPVSNASRRTSPSRSVCDAHQPGDVDQTTYPGVWIEAWRWQRRGCGTVLRFVLLKMRQRLGAIRGVYLQPNSPFLCADHAACDGGEHECAVFAIRAAPRPKHDCGISTFSPPSNSATRSGGLLAQVKGGERLSHWLPDQLVERRIRSQQPGWLGTKRTLPFARRP